MQEVIKVYVITVWARMPARLAHRRFEQLRQARNGIIALTLTPMLLITPLIQKCGDLINATRVDARFIGHVVLGLLANFFVIH